MENLEPIEISKEIEDLVKLFPCEVYIVGGKVRNHLLKIENDDFDFCSKLKIDELEEVLKGSKFELKFKNEKLGTAKIICGDRFYDYATFRKESYEKNGDREPIYVEFIDSIEEDYKRRDFTINAIYYDIKNKAYCDFCNGLDDIKKRVIRCTRSPEEVLADDGLRILRMIRIACELGLKIDKHVFLAAQKNITNLSCVSDVKIVSEIARICDSSVVGFEEKDSCKRGIKLLNKLRAWKYLGLDFEKLKPKMVNKTMPRYLGLIIDIVDSQKPASISYFLNKLFERFSLSKKKKEEIINIISGYYDALNRIPNKVYFAKYFDNFNLIYEILRQKSKFLASKYNFFYKYIISHKIVVKVSDLKISTRDIQKKFPKLPKKSYNLILNMVLSDIFEGKYSNDKDTIISEIEKKLKFY